MTSTLIFASRPSRLARWQTDHVIEWLKSAWDGLKFEIKIITTQGDQILEKPLPEIGGKGLFTLELERALMDGEVHVAVHSLKDLPTEVTPGLAVKVIPPRVDPRDVLVTMNGHTLESLPSGAVVGTSSNRRASQLLCIRDDLIVSSMRGNVETRIQKVLEGQYDAAILAAAGLLRLGLESRISQYLPKELMLPAPGQGALAVQCRSDDDSTLELLGAIDHLPTRLCVTAERAFLAGLGGGCSLPVGALSTLDGNRIMLDGIVAAPDGSRSLRLAAQGDDPVALGRELAQRFIKQGAGEWLSPEQLGGG